jgi:hypothetical protein
VSYRDRQKAPDARQLQDYEIKKAFQHVFAGPEGARVLDHIVQRICGVDAIVQVTSDAQAHEVLARKNVGLAIMQMALPGRDETKIEVKT